MNRSGIEWCDHTWNVVTGCLHGCSYCYAEKMTHRFNGDVRSNKQKTGCYEKSGDHLYVLNEPFIDTNGQQVIYPFGFEPTYHMYRFNMLDKLKTGCNIFIGAMADLFGDWVPNDWIQDIFYECLKHEQHNFLFLTKNPKRYCDVEIVEASNFWYGTTITKNEEIDRIMDLPAMANSFVSIEPLLEELDKDELGQALCYVDWVIIGAETGNRKGKVVPEFEWIKRIVLEADTLAIPVFMKDSLLPIVGAENMRRDFPKQLKQVRRSEKMKAKLEEACFYCGQVKDRKTMATLTAKVGRRGKNRSFACICRTCFTKFSHENGLEDVSKELWEDINEEKL